MKMNSEFLEVTVSSEYGVESLLHSRGADIEELHTDDELSSELVYMILYSAEYCPNLKTLNLCPLLFKIDLSQLRFFVSKCLKIEDFSIDDKHGSFSDSHLSIILRSQWHLKKLKLMNSLVTKRHLHLLPECLKSIDLRCCKFITIQALKPISEQCPNLTQLRTSIIFDQSKVDDLSFYWTSLESVLINTQTRLNFSSLTNLKDLTLMSSIEISLQDINHQLKQLERLQISALGVKNELLFFGNRLKTLIIKTTTPLAYDVIFSLPFCSALKFLDIKGTDISLVIEQLVQRCKNLQIINCLDSIINEKTFEALQGHAIIGRTLEVAVMMEVEH